MQLRQMTKYDLNDLHKEIDFFDRKIAYCENFEKFDSEDARAGAVQKLRVKRATLVKAAVALTGQGIQSDPKYLPRSFKNA